MMRQMASYFSPNLFIAHVLPYYFLFYREMQLEDGRFLMAAERYDALLKV